MFSATLHSPEVRALAGKICQNPTVVDLKGKDAVPETGAHAVTHAVTHDVPCHAVLCWSCCGARWYLITSLKQPWIGELPPHCGVIKNVLLVTPRCARSARRRPLQWTTSWWPWTRRRTGPGCSPRPPPSRTTPTRWTRRPGAASRRGPAPRRSARARSASSSGCWRGWPTRWAWSRRSSSAAPTSTATTSKSSCSAWVSHRAGWPAGGPAGVGAGGLSACEARS